MKDYTCDRCKKKFEHRQNYHRHLKNKIVCISNEKVSELEEGSKQNLQKLTFYEKKLKTLEEQNQEKELEIDRLKKLVEGIHDMKDNIKIIEQKIDHTPKYNNCVVNQQLNNNANKNLNFSIKLAPNEKERFDHIPKEQMLQILNNIDFTESVGDLVDAVYFNPKAPENMKWCVTDKGSYFGAIEYNSESNTLIRSKPTNDIITKHLQNLLYGMSEQLNDLRSTSSLSDQQDLNSDRFYDMMGQESYKIEYINKIKDKAYDGRNMTKALWDKLELSIEKTELTLRINTKCKQVKKYK